MRGYDRETYGSAFADVYDQWYGRDRDPEDMVRTLADLAGADATVLELGSGTCLVAAPLARRVDTVLALDVSAAMLDSCVGDEHRLRADMCELPLADRTCSVVFCAVNTFFNLIEADQQRRCVHEVARVLTDDGSFVVEAFVPDPESMSRNTVAVRSLELDKVVLHATTHDTDSQVLAGQIVEIAQTGIRLRPWMLRYLTPRQIDDLAATAGLTLVSRTADWDGQAFDEASTGHVSVYRR